MKLSLWQRCALAGVATLATVGAASPAFAISSDTTGAEAYGTSSGTWHVYDTKCDGESAYGNTLWRLPGSTATVRWRRRPPA